MARFKRLTDAEARTLSRRELLDRVEIEQKYWERKRTYTTEDRLAEREFRRILFAYISPGDAIDAAMATLEGRKSDYWDSRPGDETEEGQ